ncbi:CsoS2 family carboxysome shell protein [Thiomonas intermedia]|uniref:CsoS2 family carboxysome shell protein n=1 Tax=Thiomonas intermedia TaxID=926 RepID=UPI0009A4C3BA|nr:CsoS2 family carboxysome shell protein [Thiomonas intermedia]
MTYPADRHAQATLSGRELALKRRQAMALHGKAGSAKPAAASVRQRPEMAAALTAASSQSPQSRPASATSAAPVVRATSASASLSPPQAQLSPARARRQAMSQQGKPAVKQAVNGGPSRPSAHLRPTAAVPAASVREASASCGCVAEKSCGCGCADTASSPALSTQSAMTAPAADVSAAVRAVPMAGGRALAQARRAALAQDGKAGLRRVAQATKIAAALPGQDWQTAMSKGATARQVAMQRRHVQSLVGRAGATADASRHSGRMKARDTRAAVPVKVEEGHTLSGQRVTGTQVERSQRVSGNEPGSCRAITGTEYIGTEQFDALCKTRPAPNAPKVGVSTTLREQRVTGTEVGRSTKVTGDEPGACRAITGSDYLSAERYQEFCETRPQASAEKVGRGTTEMGQRFTGTLVDRQVKVTGGEQGADRALTGTRYSTASADTAPNKVEVSTTASGKTVTGTGVGARKSMTGDEAGACRPVTGTQYLSSEQFSQLCQTSAPTQPRKISVMSSRDGQSVTGTDVGRSTHVTGNETGSSRAVSGNQYFNAKDFGGATASAPAKVSVMQTLGGRSVTGSEVAPSPKLSGDESFGCKPVTGIDYIGAQQLGAVCEAPEAIAPITKVAVDQTWNGQRITGSNPGRASRVTGNEAGACAPISGNSYIGQGQFQTFCEAPALQQQRNVQRDSATVSLRAISGDRPGAGGSVMTGDERGACGSVTGTPYLGLDTMPGQCATSGRFVSRARPAEAPARDAAPFIFSILTPGHASLGRERGMDVTGNGLGTDRLTGSINKAEGLITGTPEFRKQDMQRFQSQQQDQQETVQRAAQRLTGEGSQQGTRISGDVWLEQSRVTGTEGASSLARNPSMRGQPRGMGSNAATFREVERPEIPSSRVTGSSGNTERGAAVTVSGGARG